jgi:hypothetical protein
MAIWRRENIHQHVNGTAPFITQRRDDESIWQAGKAIHFLKDTISKKIKTLGNIQ